MVCVLGVVVADGVAVLVVADVLFCWAKVATAKLIVNPARVSNRIFIVSLGIVHVDVQKLFTYVVQCMPFIAFLPDGSFGRIGVNGQERFGHPIFAFRISVTSHAICEKFVTITTTELLGKSERNEKERKGSSNNCWPRPQFEN